MTRRTRARAPAIAVVRIARTRSALVRTGLARTGLARTGLARTGLARTGLARIALVGLLLMSSLGDAWAHSASDAYLTLTAEASKSPGRYVIHGQWDIALRDLDFVLQLDADGDGRVTWGEVRQHRAAIDDYAYRHLHVDGGAGNRCSIRPESQMIDDHADGTYAALFFEAVCERTPAKLSLHYELFFKIDPSHRAIVVMRRGADIATALLSPDNATVDLESPRGASPSQ
jgi:hypothetical protein